MNNIQELRRQGLSICAIDTMTGFDRKSVHPYWLIESDSRVTVRVQARGLPSLVFCGLVIFSRAGNEKEKKPERNVSVESIERRMEELANEQLPDSHRSNFWTSEMDKILMAGARRGLESERKAIQKVLAMRPDLRRGTIRRDSESWHAAFRSENHIGGANTGGRRNSMIASRGPWQIWL